MLVEVIEYPRIVVLVIKLAYIVAPAKLFLYDDLKILYELDLLNVRIPYLKIAITIRVRIEGD